MTEQEYLTQHLQGPAAAGITKVLVTIGNHIPRKELIQDLAPELDELVAEKELTLVPDTLTTEQLLIEATALCAA